MVINTHNNLNTLEEIVVGPAYRSQVNPNTVICDELQELLAQPLKNYKIDCVLEQFRHTMTLSSNIHCDTFNLRRCWHFGGLL